MMGNLWHGDCLELMQEIPDGSIDMVMTDPPYGTTQCEWDSIVPLDLMWEQLKRVTKPNGAIVLMASQPFTTKLISSNMEMFKYCWVWEKTRPTGFFHAKNKPLKYHEDIVVFSSGTTVHLAQSQNRMTYNPQGIIEVNTPMAARTPPIRQGTIGLRPSHKTGWISKYKQYPRSIICYGPPNGKSIHPTQKPVPLMEYLIKTYTNEGETVLDFCMGSGTTGVAAQNLGRQFIGIEKDQKYFDIALNRIEDSKDLFTRS